jgi:hypothetical protein
MAAYYSQSPQTARGATPPAAQGKLRRINGHPRSSARTCADRVIPLPLIRPCAASPRSRRRAGVMRDLPAHTPSPISER